MIENPVTRAKILLRDAEKHPERYDGTDAVLFAATIVERDAEVQRLRSRLRRACELERVLWGGRLPQKEPDTSFYEVHAPDLQVLHAFLREVEGEA